MGWEGGWSEVRGQGERGWGVRGREDDGSGSGRDGSTSGQLRGWVEWEEEGGVGEGWGGGGGKGK